MDYSVPATPLFQHESQSRLTQFDDQILALYAKGVGTQHIVVMFKEKCNVEVSASVISNVTDAVLDHWSHSSRAEVK